MSQNVTKFQHRKMAAKANEHTMRSYVTTSWHRSTSRISSHLIGGLTCPSMFLDAPVFRAAGLFQFGQGCFEIPGGTAALAGRAKKSKTKKHGNRFGDGLNLHCFDLDQFGLFFSVSCGHCPCAQSFELSLPACNIHGSNSPVSIACSQKHCITEATKNCQCCYSSKLSIQVVNKCTIIIYNYYTICPSLSFGCVFRKTLKATKSRNTGA